MSRYFEDPLLSLTSKLLRFCYVACFTLIGMLLLGVLVASLGPDLLGDTVADFAAGLFAGVVGSRIDPLAFLMTILFYGWFLRTLREIVDTVRTGTPFSRQNADRLARMGWAAAGLKVITIAVSLLLASALHRAGPPPTDLAAPGLITILILFVLARVFRQGAAMRADLEGTV